MVALCGESDLFRIDHCAVMLFLSVNMVEDKVVFYLILQLSESILRTGVSRHFRWSIN